MTKRASNKRKQRRQRDLEKDFNTNGIDHRPGQYRVFHRKNRTYQTPPLAWEEAVKFWQDCDNCIILEAR